MMITVYGDVDALETWRNQGLVRAVSMASPDKIKIVFSQAEIARIEKNKEGFILHRANWRRPGPDRGDKL